MCKKRKIRRNMERQLKKILSRSKLNLEIFRPEYCLDGYQTKETSEIDRLTEAINYSHQDDIYYEK